MERHGGGQTRIAQLRDCWLRCHAVVPPSEWQIIRYERNEDNDFNSATRFGSRISVRLTPSHTWYVSSLVTQSRAAAAVATAAAAPATDKVFLYTTPFPDVINAISCARPLLRPASLHCLSLNLHLPTTCVCALPLLQTGHLERSSSRLN